MKPLIIKAVLLAAAVTSLSAAANDASAARNTYLQTPVIENEDETSDEN